MKKTLTANISGTVFHIEEDAYTAMHRYLSSIRSQFEGSEGQDEIMADIEARISELFTERLDGRRQVVSMADVDHVIGVMGQPEDYSSEEPGQAGGSAGSANWSTTSGGHKRLFRDPDDKWVGGVLGGIGAYFNIDPLILRLIYLVFLFLGFGFILYVILWAVVPKATTAAEKLSMRGEAVNVENLKRQFNEGAERFEKGAREVAEEAREMGRRYVPRARKSSEEFLGFLGQAGRLILTALGKIFGFFFLLAGSVFAIALIVAMLGHYDLMMNNTGLGNGPELHQWTMLLFETPAQSTWAWVALMVFLLIPVIGLLYGGIHLLFDVKAPKWFGLALAPIWIASIIVLSFVGARFGNQFRTKEVIRDVIDLQEPVGQTLTLAAIENGRQGDWMRSYHRDLDQVEVEGDSVHMAWADLDIRQSRDQQFHIVFERRARGAAGKEAYQRARSIVNRYEHHDSLLLLTPWYSFQVGDHYRGQRVHVVVEVPIGRAVHFDSSIQGMMYDIDNVDNTLDRDMVGRTWTMTQKGLSDRVAPEDVPDDIRPNSDTPKATATTTTVVTRTKTLVLPDLWSVMRPGA